MYWPERVSALTSIAYEVSEYQFDKLGVTGSSPVSPTHDPEERKLLRGRTLRTQHPPTRGNRFEGILKGPKQPTVCPTVCLNHNQSPSARLPVGTSRIFRHRIHSRRVGNTAPQVIAVLLNPAGRRGRPGGAPRAAQSRRSGWVCPGNYGREEWGSVFGSSVSFRQACMNRFGGFGIVGCRDDT